jgi:hypothetical protein
MRVNRVPIWRGRGVNAHKTTIGGERVRARVATANPRGVPALAGPRGICGGGPSAKLNSEPSTVMTSDLSIVLPAGAQRSKDDTHPRVAHTFRVLLTVCMDDPSQDWCSNTCLSKYLLDDTYDRICQLRQPRAESICWSSRRRQHASCESSISIHRAWKS